MDVFERLRRDNMVCTSKFEDYMAGFERLDYCYTNEEHFKNHQAIMHNFGYATEFVCFDPEINNQNKFKMVGAVYRKSL